MFTHPDGQVFIAGLVRRLHEDLLLLQRGYEFAEQATRQFCERHELDSLPDFMDVEFAAWVIVRFEFDEEGFHRHLDQLQRGHDKLHADLFSLGTPDKIDPDLRADTHLDRIDLAINYLTSWLKLPLPSGMQPPSGAGYTIRSARWSGRRHIERTLAFAEAARQLFAPSLD